MSTPTVGHRRGKLALALQEAFTAAARLRANRQVATDAESFRAHIKQLIRDADEQARRAGYSSETVKLAMYAFIVFLDECVLNSAQPMFAGWPRKPLQEEVFGGHMGGQIFFQYLRDQLSQADSEEIADLLEVYQLCLLLGFQGRYSTTDKGELHALTQQVSDKIQRIRGGFGPLSPSWSPPSDEVLPDTKDPWIGRLTYGAVGAAVFVVLLWLVFNFSLSAGAGRIQDLVR